MIHLFAAMSFVMATLGGGGSGGPEKRERDKKKKISFCIRFIRSIFKGMPGEEKRKGQWGKSERRKTFPFASCSGREDFYSGLYGFILPFWAQVWGRLYDVNNESL